MIRSPGYQAPQDWLSRTLTLSSVRFPQFASADRQVPRFASGRSCRSTRCLSSVRFCACPRSASARSASRSASLLGPLPRFASFQNRSVARLGSNPAKLERLACRLSDEPADPERAEPPRPALPRRNGPRHPPSPRAL